MKQNPYNANTQSQNVSYAHFTSSTKVFESISQTEHVNAKSTEFQETFNLIKQIETLIEPYRAKKSELPLIENLEKVLQGYHAAYSSCANLQMSL